MEAVYMQANGQKVTMYPHIQTNNHITHTHTTHTNRQMAHTHIHPTYTHTHTTNTQNTHIHTQTIISHTHTHTHTQRERERSTHTHMHTVRHKIFTRCLQAAYNVRTQAGRKQPTAREFPPPDPVSCVKLTVFFLCLIIFASRVT